jgi:putative hemolysin
LISDSLSSVISLAISGGIFFFLSLMEASLVRFQEIEGHEQPPQTRLAAHLLRRMSTYMETIAMFQLASIIAGTLSVAALVFSGAFVSSDWIAAILGGCALLFLLMIIRTGARWTIAHQFLPLGKRWIAAMTVLLWPATLLTRVLLRIWWMQDREEASTPFPRSRSEQRSLSLSRKDHATPGSRTDLDHRERSMVTAIHHMEKTTVAEIMTPRVDFVAVDASSSLNQAVSVMMEKGHSRLPVFEETIDKIAGIVHARDLMIQPNGRNGATVLRDLARPAYFVPEFKKINELLQEFQDKRVHMALVVDEYGGIAGLVTIEDLLEEIVGEIADEFDVGEEPGLEMVTETEAIMDARVPLDTVNNAFSAGLTGDGFGTMGGLVYSLLGKMPSPGDEVLCDDLKITVLSTYGRRIKKVRVTRSVETEEASGQ